MKTAMLISTLLFGTAVLAADHDDARREVKAGHFRPLAEVLADVQSRHAGSVLDVELDRNEKGRHIYEVRLLDRNGQRREIHIDAVTGKEVVADVVRKLADMPSFLRRVLQTHPGHVVDVDLQRSRSGKEIYQVRVLQANGQVRGVFVDAITGGIVSDVGFVAPSARMKTLPDLIDGLQAEYVGIILEAELKYDRDERPFYEIDMQLHDGRQIELSLDPVTGRVLSEDEIEVR